MLWLLVGLCSNILLYDEIGNVLFFNYSMNLSSDVSARCSRAGVVLLLDPLAFLDALIILTLRMARASNRNVGR